MNQEAILPPQAADCGGAGGAQVHAALMDVYTTHYQPPELRNHMLPARWALTAAIKLKF